MSDDSNRQNLNSHSKKRTRRRILQTGGLLGISALAGCSGLGDSDGGGSTQVGDGNAVDERIDARFVYPHYGRDPIEMWTPNPYNPTINFHGVREPGGHLLNSAFGWYVGEPWNDYTYILGESHEMVDDLTIELTLRDDLTWHDGTPYTMEDFHVQMRLDELVERIGTPEEDRGENWRWHQYIRDYELVDETTYRLHLWEPPLDGVSTYPEQLIKGASDPTILPTYLNVKADLFEDWADDLESALDSSQEEAESTLQEFLEWDVDGEFYGNGPFQFKERNDTLFLMEVFEDFPYSDTILFTEYAVEEFSDRQEAFIQGMADIEPEIVWDEGTSEQAPQYDTLARDGADFRQEVIFNLGEFESSDTPSNPGIYDPVTKATESGFYVRKAFNWALDRNAIGEALGFNSETLEIPPMKMDLNLVDEEPYSAWIDEFESYGPGSDMDRAAEYLEQAGYTYDDGSENWVDDSGEPLEITILSPSEGGLLQVCQVATANLEELGVTVELNATDQFYQQRFEGAYDIIPNNSPYNGLNNMFRPIMLNWSTAWLAHGTGTWQVPSEIGDPSSELEEIDMQDEIENFIYTQEEDALERMMWAVNQYLPFAGQATSLWGSAINTEKWHVEGPERHLYGLQYADQHLFHLPTVTVAPIEDAQ